MLPKDIIFLEPQMFGKYKVITNFILIRSRFINLNKLASNSVSFTRCDVGYRDNTVYIIQGKSFDIKISERGYKRINCCILNKIPKGRYVFKEICDNGFIYELKK